MKVELKQVVDQLSEALLLPENYKVSACIDGECDIVGWTIVKVEKDGTLTPLYDHMFKNIQELMEVKI